MKYWPLFLATIPLAACSSTTTTDGGADAPIASDVALDTLVEDAPIDASGDVSLFDVNDGSSTNFVGRWRLVSVDINAPGSTVHLTDTNMPIAGTMAVGRANGQLTLEANRFALAYGVLANDHFLMRQDAATYAAAISAGGASAAGTLTGLTFAIAGGTASLTWTTNTDGTISNTDMSTGNVTTWARAAAPTATTALLAEGMAARYRPATAMPLMRPRVALAWDNAGGPGRTMSNDAPLTFGATGFATYSVNVASIPPAAIGDIGGTQIAIAYIVVYDDLDSSNSFTPSVGDGGAGDMLRGISPVGIAYRSMDPASAAFSVSSLRDIGPGYQFVDFHVDFSSRSIGVLPFDPTHVVAPDIVVDVGPVTVAFPDLVP